MVLLGEEERLKQTWSLEPTTFQGQSLTAFDITLLTSTVILAGLLRYPERLRVHGHPAAAAAAWHCKLCISLELCCLLGCPGIPEPSAAWGNHLEGALCLLQQLCLAILEGKGKKG